MLPNENNVRFYSKFSIIELLAMDILVEWAAGGARITEKHIRIYSFDFMKWILNHGNAYSIRAYVLQCFAFSSYSLCIVIASRNSPELSSKH